MIINDIVTLSHQELNKIFGENQGFWEYRDQKNNFVCYTVRKINKKTGKKYFTPYTFQNNEWDSKFLKDENGETIKNRPIYNVKEIYDRPLDPILLVEGEKTADAGKYFFPEMISVTWLGGSGMAKAADFYHFKNRTVYFIPDNDEAGYKAADAIITILLNLNVKLHFFDIKKYNLPEHWDVANLYDEHGEIAVDDMLMMIRECPEYVQKIPEFDPSSYPDMSNSKHPKPLDTMNNVKYLLKHYNIDCKWNMMSRIRQINVPGNSFYIEEADNASLNYITDLAVTHNLSIRRIDKHLDAISWNSTYHPVRDWILSKNLNDGGIFNKFLNTIKTTNDELSHMLLKKWMLSAVYAVFNDTNFCAQGVLVIQGDPGTHKSSFVMSLAPESLRAIKGGLSLDPSKKDDIFTSSEYWIAELGELDATFRKADIARLKSHITNDIDDVRRPHAIRNSRMIRRTVYAATVNENKFLVDTTGNRRWWTISITEPIDTRHGLDMQQIWRYVYELYLQNESPFLNKEEMSILNESNKEFEMIDPFYEKILHKFFWNKEPSVWMSSTQVLNEIGYDKPSKGDLKRMGDILAKKINLKKGTGRLRYSYLLPERKLYNENNIYEKQYVSDV